MYEHSLWSFSLGRWAGVNVRLHMFFMLFAAFTLLLSLQHARPEMVWLAVISLIILLASVFLHELAHCSAAVRLGVYVEQIVIGPIGGMFPLRCSSSPKRELAITASGPLMNLLVCLICIPPIFFLPEVRLVELVHPLRPGNLVEGTTLAVAIKLIFWINWLLLLVNLLPAFPLDGGRILRLMLLILRPDFGSRTAIMHVASVAKLGALGLIVAAWFVRSYGSGSPIPPWFVLVVLAIFIFFSARQEVDRYEEEQRDDEFIGYDFSQGFTSLEQSTKTTQTQTSAAGPGPLARWLQMRRDKRQRRLLETEAEEDRHVDEILSRLNETGWSGLSIDDRRLLDRASARYRNRMDQ